MMDMIRARRTSSDKEERYDLFSSLLDANELERDSAAQLTDDKLFGESTIQRV